MPEQFSREQLVQALEELGSLAVAAGKVIDIAIYGGSCLMLASNFRVSTADVDAVAVSDQAFIDQAARTIAVRHGWPNDWLNDGVRTYLSPVVDMPGHHELLRAYPSEPEPGVRVFLPTAEYMLAMKLMAMRIDAASGQKDLTDILNLLEIVGLRNREDTIAFAAGFYPEARVSARLVLAIDALLKLQEDRAKEIDAGGSPEYLGRTGPAR